MTFKKRETKSKYLQILYDRIPTLPQSLQKDFDILRHFWPNIAFRIARSEKIKPVKRFL